MTDTATLYSFLVVIGLNSRTLLRTVYRDGHVFLEAYGAAHGALDAGLEVLRLGKQEQRRCRSRTSEI